MSKPRVLIFSGYGLNCEEEAKIAFEESGAVADIVHLEDVIASPKMLKNYQIAVFPGGFSYGDDAGSGKAYGKRVSHHLKDELQKFLSRDTLMAGICNGFQIVTSAGILPGALIANDSARFSCRWVDLEVVGESPWLTGIKMLSVPIGHGEGKYYNSEKALDLLESKGQVALKYVKGKMSTCFDLPANPNGALRDIAGITGYEGRVLGLMPHPERGSFFTQLPHWTYLREKYEREGKKAPKHAEGIEVFRNAVKYFT
ncbi:MAG: phosphoribosylformylglycinamidine synthase subunit PurQ [Patescibacteria group bacterium]